MLLFCNHFILTKKNINIFFSHNTFMKNKTFFKGALILIIFNLIGKAIGAVYRIPLANILGSQGMGQYQLVFPLYCLILTISTSGIPVAISKMVAEFNVQKRYTDAKKLLYISIFLLSLVSILGFLFVISFSKIIANFQGNSECYICYYGIAPSILFVGVISAFRGYFQGNLNMIPTALSNFLEQVFKMVFGLMLARYLLPLGVTYAVMGALIGISLSEFISFVFLIIYYLFYSKRFKQLRNDNVMSYKKLSKGLIGLSVPITLGGLISPLTSMVDSLIVVNLLILTGLSSGIATSLLGLQAGVVEPLINLPTVIAISISTVLLPNISGLSASGNKEKIVELIKKSVQISLSISMAFAICYIIFGSQILNFLYGKSLLVEELVLSTKLLFLACINIIFLSLVQVFAGILQGLGEAKYTVKSLLIGCIVKTILETILVSIKAINIYGVVISAGACYFIIFTLNYSKVKKVVDFKLSEIYSNVILQECVVCIVAFISNFAFKLIFSELTSMLIAGSLAVLAFAVTYYLFFMMNKDKILNEDTYKKT